MPILLPLRAPTTPFAQAAYTGLADVVFLAWIRANGQDAVVTSSPTSRRALLDRAHAAVAALPLPPSPAAVRVARDALGVDVAIEDGVDDSPTDRMARWRLVDDAQAAQERTVPGVWLAWLAADAVEAMAFWPPLTGPQSSLALDPRTHTHDWAEALLIDTLKAGISAGTCAAGACWSLAQHTANPRMTMHCLWVAIDGAWKRASGALPAPEVAFVDAALRLPRPRGRAAIRAHAAWRTEAHVLLRAHLHRPEAEALVETHLRSRDTTVPYTDDELAVTILSRTAAPAEALAVIRRLTIPTVGRSFSHAQSATLELATAARHIGIAADEVWQALWARAPRAGQRVMLLLNANFAAAGPWWRDPSFAHDALASLATIPASLIPSVRNVLTMDVLHSLVGLPGVAGAWLRAYQRCWPHDLRDALWILRYRLPDWALTPDDLTPLLSSDDAEIRVMVQSLFARTTGPGPIPALPMVSAPVPRRPSLG